MRRPYQILWPLLSLFLVRVDLTDLVPLKIPVKVLKIYDGDTILVSHGSYQMKVRLSKIDSPEKTQPFLNGAGDAGAWAGRCLKKNVPIGSLQQLWIEKEDIYGRILGDLKGLSLKLVERGCTTLYPHAQFSSVREKFTYLRALKKAKARKSGLWQYGGFRQPKLWRKFSKRNGHRQ
ncbi:MAG: thermonuclease family protein [Bacteriovoracaceae bacterium]|nr:thermonuclease family protein [Bacteriovoracaceae bacterium]